MHVPGAHLFLPTAVINHAVLRCHGRRIVQRGSIEWHLLDLGDVVGNIRHAHAVCLVHIAPVLEELLEQWSLAHFGEDLHLSVLRVAHLLNEAICCFHGSLALLNVGVLSCLASSQNLYHTEFF